MSRSPVVFVSAVSHLLLFHLQHNPSIVERACASARCGYVQEGDTTTCTLEHLLERPQKHGAKEIDQRLLISVQNAELFQLFKLFSCSKDADECKSTNVRSIVRCIEGTFSEIAAFVEDRARVRSK